MAIAAFLITSLIIARLVSRVSKQAEDALSSVRYKVIEAEERERQRFAKNLHEDIGQRLTLLAIEIERIKPDSLDAIGVRSRMDTLLEQILEILSDVKALAHDLHSPRLEYLGIADVMSSFCEVFADRKSVEITLRATACPVSYQRTLHSASSAYYRNPCTMRCNIVARGSSMPNCGQLRARFI